MNSTWIIQENNTRLVIFFNGWGFDRTAISDVEITDFDIIEFNDYSNLDFDEDLFDSYTQIYLVAWSLGVWAASFILKNSDIKIKKAIAINGTINPIDSKVGIPPTIFEGTLNGWNEINRSRFMMRVIGGKEEFKNNQLKFGVRSLENQKTELSCLSGYIQKNNKSTFKFDTALIGNQDAIFTKENQLHFWENKARCINIDMPHFPFLHCPSWEYIISI